MDVIFNPHYLPEFQPTMKRENKTLCKSSTDLEKAEIETFLWGSVSSDEDSQNDLNMEWNKYGKLFLPATFIEQVYDGIFMEDEDEEDNIYRNSEEAKVEHLRIKEYLHNCPVELEDGSTISLEWDMASLADDPYRALSTWKKAYENYCRLDSVPPNLQYAFHRSTLLLICCFKNCDRGNDSDPWKESQYLISAFQRTQNAFWALRQIYPEVDAGKTNDISCMNVFRFEHARELFNATDKILPSHIERIKLETKWQTYDKVFYELTVGLQDIFKKYVEKNGITMANELLSQKVLETIVDGIVNDIRNDAYKTFLLPFICTKTFAGMLYFDNEAKKAKLYHGDDDLETYERLFDDHHSIRKKIVPFRMNPDINPVICFMRDIIHFVFDFDAKYAKVTQFREINKMDTNWLALYLYGRRRFFGSNMICSYHSGLTLPVLVETLFGDGCGNVDTCDDWYFSKFSRADKEIYRKLSPTEKKDLSNILLGDFVFAEDGTGLLLDPFDELLWRDGEFIPQRQTQKSVAAEINQAIAQAKEALKGRDDATELATEITRLECARMQFYHESKKHEGASSIYDVLCEYINSLYHLNKSREMMEKTYAYLEIMKQYIKEKGMGTEISGDL